MITDKITVSAGHGTLNAAIEQADKVALYKDLNAQQSMRLRLLAEEMTGLMNAVVGKREGVFWIENNDDMYELHFKTNAMLGDEKRQQLLSASTTGKNEAARGLIGKIVDFFTYTEDGDTPVFHTPLMLSGMSGSYHDYEWTSEYYYEWSLGQYRQEVDDANQQASPTAEAKEAWDELEKSVIAHIADDVKVFIRGRQVEMTIYKKL